MPVPLRRLDEIGRVVAHPLGAGEAALIDRTLGRVTVIVAESIEPGLRTAIAEHAYRRHPDACLAATCPVAKAALPAAVAEAVIA